MRGVMIALALALFGGAGWATAAARESDAQHNTRIAACMAEKRDQWRRMTAPLRTEEPMLPGMIDGCGRIPRAWDQQTLILAAVLGIGGVLALIGAGAARRAERG